MQNEYLKSLNENPVKNTFNLSYEMFKSNKILFIFMTFIYILFAASEFVIPFLFVGGFTQNAMTGLVIFVTLLSFASQVFTESNYLYISKLVLDSDSQEACTQNVFSMKVSKLFFEYFIRAIGSTLAMFIIIIPFVLLANEFRIGRDILIILLVPLLYIYPLVAYKIVLTQNVYESFRKTFSMLSPSLWKQGLNLKYAKFIISMMLIIFGAYSLLLYLFDFIEGSMYVVSVFIMIIPAMFVSLYVMPVTMMIAQSLTIKTESETE